MMTGSLEDADRESKLEDWLASRNKKRPLARWNMKEKRELRKLFNSLDFDGSGEIDCDELADTLLSCNIAKTVAEVNALVHAVDEDNSGSIGFNEFLKAMPPPQLSMQQRSGRRTTLEEKHNVDPIARLRSIQDENMSIQTLVSIKRRKLLMEATLSGAKRRTEMLDIMSKQRREVHDMTGHSKRKQFFEVNLNERLLRNIEFETQSLIKSIGGVVNKLLIGHEANANELVVTTRVSDSRRGTLNNATTVVTSRETSIDTGDYVEKSEIRNTLVNMCQEKLINGEVEDSEGHRRRSALVVPLRRIPQRSNALPCLDREAM